MNKIQNICGDHYDTINWWWGMWYEISVFMNMVIYICGFEYDEIEGDAYETIHLFDWC